MWQRSLSVLMLIGWWPVCALATDAGSGQPETQDSIRVLVVTGVDYAGHKWKLTGPALRDVLEQDERFDVRIVEDPEILATDVIFDFDAVFIHFKNYDPLRREAEARENLTRFVREGGGLALLHFACGAFPGWPEFEDLAGKVWDEAMTGGYHDPRGPFTIKVTDADHAITRDMQDFRADDELYYCLKGIRDVRTLATARSKVTGKDHPMAFVFDYGKGRVFHTPLGHDVKAIQMQGVAELLRRGTVWVGGRETTNSTNSK